MTRTALRRHLSTLGGYFVDAHCRGVAFVHAGRVFCGCALPGGGICPRWRGVLWIDAPAGNGFSRKLATFGDIVPLRQWFLPERYLYRGQKYFPWRRYGVFSRKLLPFGDKVPAGNGFSRKLLSFGDKVPAGNGFSRKLLPFGDKNQHFMACITGGFADICSFIKKIWPTAE